MYYDTYFVSICGNKIKNVEINCFTDGGESLVHDPFPHFSRQEHEKKGKQGKGGGKGMEEGEFEEHGEARRRQSNLRLTIKTTD